MSNKLENSFKRLVKIYVTYDETAWGKLASLKRQFIYEVVDSSLDPSTKISVLDALKFECKFSDKYDRYAIEKVLKDAARLLGVYDEWIFCSIDSHDQHSAMVEVLSKW